MKCVICGSNKMKTRHETRAYDAGLDMPVTLDSAEVHYCPDCGEEEVVVERIEQLHKQIAERVANKPERLTAKEIRFLRTFLGLSGADTAAELGVDATTVSRWENDRAGMSQTAERLLRLLALTGSPKRHYPLREMAKTKAKPVRLRAHRRDGQWLAEVHT